MAERRMFSKAVVDTDRFLNLPLTTQALYFHLGMQADDDGFVANPKKIIRMIGCSEGDFTILIEAGFLIPFPETGVVVITHWKVNNYLRSDRYAETLHTVEKSRLQTLTNKIYSLGIPDGIPDGTPLGIPDGIPVVDADKYSIDKSIILGEKSPKPPKKSSVFVPPTLGDITEYCQNRKSPVDPQQFLDYYESSGWMRGKTKIKDWKACIRTWEKNALTSQNQNATTPEEPRRITIIDEGEDAQ